jgi:hypothetical protein
MDAINECWTPVVHEASASSPTLQRSDYPYPRLTLSLANLAQNNARANFVSLPGVVCARLAAGESPGGVAEWAYGIFEKWGCQILETGSVDSTSADGTLWFCHALAAVWVLSLDFSKDGVVAEAGPFADFESRFAPALRAAIGAISEGRHPLLGLAERGLLEVTEPNRTWMGSETGVLPELNALWFQARFLNFLWSGEEALYDLERLGGEVLHLREVERADEVFLHHLPLAPSFIQKDWSSLRSELRNLRKRFLMASPSEIRIRKSRSMESKLSRTLTRLWIKDMKHA